MGNAYVVGSTLGTLPGQTSAGSEDVFIRKYDSDGNEIWTRQGGTSTVEQAFGVAVDRLTGTIMVVGNTFDTFAGQMLAGSGDVFLRTYDSAGNELWTRQFGSSDFDVALGVAVDEFSGNISVAGWTLGILPDQTTSGGINAFVRTYDADGNALWTHQFGPNDGARGSDVAVDGVGNVYVSGEAGSLGPDLPAGFFIRQYDAVGNAQWTQQFTASSHQFSSPDESAGIAVDGMNNVYLVGSTSGVLPDQLSSGHFDAFIAQITGAPPQTCAQSPAGLVSWWPMEETVSDSADENNPVAINALSFVSGKVGLGVTFGTGGFIDLPDAENLRNQQFTLAAWVRPDGPGPNSDGSVIIQKVFLTDCCTASAGLWWSGSDQRFFTISGNMNTTRVTSVQSFPPGQFYHVAATYDGATLKLFVNGALEGQRFLRTTVPYQPGPWTIGSTPAPFRDPGGIFQGFPRTWNGVIDEVEVFNRALSQAEIQAMAACADNQAPIAHAGLDQAAHPGDLVTLDGSGSSDPDGDYPLIYAWEITSSPAGSNATLLNPDTVNPSFTPDLPGDYTISLVVTDARGLASGPDQVLVSTINTPPVADAGDDQAILVTGSTVQLNGSQSYDGDGDLITFQWTMIAKPVGSAATLSGADTATPSFIADVQGDYIISLTVTDVFGAVSEADTVTVSFNNVQPVANAGGNQAVLAGDTVFLDGSGSSDANQDPLTYAWSIVSAPDGSTATLGSTTSVQTSFVADLPGNYVIHLVVHDGVVASDPSNVTIMAMSRQSVVFQTLEETINTINALNLDGLKNRTMQHALTNKINAVLELVDQGLYSDALAKLQHDILDKTNGCVAAANTPDNNDWITDCAAQQQVYPLITQAIELLLG